MADISKISPDDGSTILNIKDNNAVHWSDNTILGAKNLIDNTGVTQTITGITFTVNSDKSITVNGTATNNTVFYLQNWFIPNWETGKEYHLTDVNGYTDCYTYMARKKGTSGSVDYTIETKTTEARKRFFYNPEEFDYYFIAIYVPNGKTINNVTLYPMLRLNTDTDDTYVPYAMTNRELTKIILRSIFSPKVLYSTDDLDSFYGSLDKAGIYQWGGSVPTHAPTFGGSGGLSYCTLFVFPSGTGDVSSAWTHVCIQGGWRPADKHIAIRGYGGNPYAWSEWRYITDATLPS